MLQNRDLVERWLYTHNFQEGHTHGDSPYNAMKHAMFQALNTCDIGMHHTGEMAIYHEECNGVKAGGNESIVMDTHNNSVGMSIAKSVGCNFDNLSNAVISAFLNGQLHKIDGQPTP